MPKTRLIAVLLGTLVWTWSAALCAGPRISLEDDFSDGTLAPWQQLNAGTVALEPEGGGYVLRKSGNSDPNGGWTPLATPGRRLRAGRSDP